jgi:hypothetical protein
MFHLLLAVTIVLLVIPALYPLLDDWFTCGYDNSFHLWRAVEVYSLLKQGVLYPRWAADMAHGYGLPLFNFMPPLSAFVPALLHVGSIPWAQAINLTFALGLLLSGLTMFLFVRDYFGTSAGLVSAVAYVYAPFQAYDVFNRGSLSQAFAWWLAPLLLWSLGRWHSRRGGGVMLIVAAGSMAALVLTHNVFAFLFGPLLVGLLLLPPSTSDPAEKWPTWAGIGRGALPILLGLGLAAFFWLPGLLERDWVQTQRLLGVWVFDYRNNFIGLGDLLALPRTTDPALVNDWPPRALGLVPLLVALLPLLGWRRFSRSQRWLIILMLTGTVVFGLMSLPVSRLLWDNLPLLPYVQFPWRFLGPAAFCAAVLAGVTVPALGNTPRSQTIISVILIATLFVADAGWFFPDHCPPPGNATLAGMIQWEQATDTLGTTAGGEYLPVWVKRLPGRSQISADYVNGGAIQRLDSEVLPPGAEIIRADYGPLGAEIEIDSPEPFQARYLAFYYPGWQASVDEQAVKVTPSEPQGLITFDVPAGRHVIRVRFGSTPLRTGATILSTLSLIALPLLAVFTISKTRTGTSAATRSTSLPSTRLPITLLSLFLLLGFALVAARFLIAEGHTPLRQTRLADEDGQLQSVDQPYVVDFGHRWTLLGLDQLPQQIAGDEPLEAVLYWRAEDAQGRDYAASIALVDGTGKQWTAIGMRSPRWHRTPPPVHAWPDGSYAMTAYLADLLPGTPPGDYRAVLTSFDKKTPQVPLTAYHPDGAALGPALDLGGVRVGRPSKPIGPTDVSTGTRFDSPLGPLVLVGADLDRQEAAPGDPAMVTLFWHIPEAEQTAPAGDTLPDLSARLALLDTTGAEAMAWDLPPVRADWPTTLWQPGDLWRGQHVLRLPGALQSGDYTWQLQLTDPQQPQSPLPDATVVLGALRINAPERNWQAPPLQLPLDADLGGQVTLLGANLKPVTASSGVLKPSDTLTVTLVWQGQVEMDTSYRVFLHLLGPDGSLLVQSDGEPADWTRPTTGWAPGEVVLDQRVLTVPDDAPPGQYTLTTGLYQASTGDRLTLSDRSTAILVTPFIIQEP